MHRRPQISKKLLANLLITAGILSMCWPGVMWAYGQYAQQRLEREFAEEESTAVAGVQVASATKTPPLVERKTMIIARRVRPTPRPQAMPKKQPAKPKPKTPVTTVAEVPLPTYTPIATYSYPAFPELAKPQVGKPLARLRIPSIDLEAIVIEGAGDVQLHRGPGHMKQTPLPGEVGNCVIAGHRAYWFRRLPEVQRGAPVWVETPLWRYKYIVEEKRVVTPDRGDLLNRTDDMFLTLVTCTTPTADSTHRALVFCRLEELIPR